MPLYEWVADWIDLPPTPVGWMHSGIAIVDRNVVVAHPGEPTLLSYDADGNLRNTTPLEDLLEPHGFEPLDGAMWIGDVGFKRRVHGSEFENEVGVGRVVCLDDSGAVSNELVDPTGGWSPTAVAVVEETGDIWVADGYGQNLVHRFDADGSCVQTLTGEEGAGRFQCPHGVVVDRRRGSPEMYVSDRANARIQVYDPEGRFLRIVGEGIVVTPTDMTIVGDELALTDFTQARVTILDIHDRLVEHIGKHPEAPTRDGWPNARDENGDPLFDLASRRASSTVRTRSRPTTQAISTSRSGCSVDGCRSSHAAANPNAHAQGTTPRLGQRSGMTPERCAASSVLPESCHRA